MTLREISNLRLASQQITGGRFKTAKEIVNWMGAIQAQDFAMSKWAIGLRVNDFTEKSITAIIDSGEIIRTHLMRPTWHLVSSEDIYWLLELTAPHIRSSMKGRHRELELSESLLKKTNGIIRKSLLGNNHLTREELVLILEAAGIYTVNNRGSHIFLNAELDGIICSGPSKGKKQTYALLDERVAKAHNLSREEALKKLAFKYFLSHGPATLRDFKWWSGLPARDTREALEMIKMNLVSEETGKEIFWFDKSLQQSASVENEVHLLPAYDEFIISYQTRSPSFPLIHQRKISENGFFRPVVVINGQVSGSWKRTDEKDKLIIEISLFQSPRRHLKDLIEKEAEDFGHFSEKKTEISYNADHYGGKV